MIAAERLQGEVGIDHLVVGIAVEKLDRLVLTYGYRKDSAKSATLDPDKWTVHFEADTKDKAGAIGYVIDGKIDNLPMPNRTITGTWKSQRGSGAFKIQRQ